VSSDSFPSAHIPDLVLANPTAGGGLAMEMIPRLQKFAQAHKWNTELHGARSAQEFAEIARKESERGRERIFALGGDGTFQVLLNAVAPNPRLSLGVLPAGGGNDLAKALGLPLNAVRAAQAILLGGECVPVDAAHVRTADGNARLYMGGGGVGLDAEAACFASGPYSSMRGRSRYLLSALRALRKFQPLKVRLGLPAAGQSFFDCEALLVGVLNTPSYGAGLRLAPEADLQDGALDLVILADLGWREVLRILPGLAARGEIYTNRIRRQRVTKVRIETDRPCMFQGDGELIGPAPVEISVVPEAMRVWRCRPHGEPS
jgi:diacylglycerol kinase (ATP)